MKIFCWNINSIRTRTGILEKLVLDHLPDIILLQETKCMDEAFPREFVFDLGYNSYTFGQKSYNGVAILSKTPVEDISTEFVAQNSDARYIEGRVPFAGEMITVASVYVPNGFEPKSDKFQYKMKFFKALEEKFENAIATQEKYIIGGDLNVAPEANDVYDAKYLDGKIGFHIAERAWFRRFQNLGMVDAYRVFNGDSCEFSWWDYRTRGFDTGKGMRIDHILTTPNMLNNVTSAGIYSEYRGLEKPSDHTPIFVELDGDALPS